MALAARRRPFHHARFVQPKLPAFWLYMVLLVATGVVAVAQEAVFRNAAPGGFALSWLLLAVYALPVFFLVYLLDLYEREPLSLMVAAFLWGAIVATTLSAVANGGWGLVVARIGGPEFAAVRVFEHRLRIVSTPSVSEAAVGTGAG